MISNLNALPPNPFKLASVGLSSSSVSSGELENLGKHFPSRKVEEYSSQRQVEHLGVSSCVRTILEHDNWHLIYNEDGAPILYEYQKPSKNSITITHTKINDETVVFVSISQKNGEKIGMDLTAKGDQRLSRVAPRTMSQIEVDSGKLEEVWAIKEAMFKAYGPGVDFKDELKVEVNDLLEGREYVKSEFRGKISTWWVVSEAEFVLALGPC